MSSENVTEGHNKSTSNLQQNAPQPTATEANGFDEASLLATLTPDAAEKSTKVIDPSSESVSGLNQLPTGNGNVVTSEDEDSAQSHLASGSSSAGLMGSKPDDDTLNEAKWKPASTEALSWVHDQMTLGIAPREILAHLLNQDPGDIPQDLDTAAIWRIVVQLLTEPPRRKRLNQFNTLDDAVSLIQRSKRIIVLTGAGISVSCGIPDFRSKNGIYARLHVDFPDLPCPQAMFDIEFFRKNPRPFYEFAKEIYPGQFKPSLTHQFIRRLEEDGKLLRNYTQNIDTLEDTAGIRNVIQCHGSFSHATCCTCGYKTDCEAIREDIFQSKIPHCPCCPEDAAFPVIKPDIVFFGESLPDTFHDSITEDKDHVDLLIVIGSSLKVRPVALIPSSIPSHVPQILINRDPLDHMELDIELLGNADVVVEELCYRLGDSYSGLCADDKVRMERIDELPEEASPPQSTVHGILSNTSANLVQTPENVKESTAGTSHVGEQRGETTDKVSVVDEASATVQQDERAETVSKKLKLDEHATEKVNCGRSNGVTAHSENDDEPMRVSESGSEVEHSAGECHERHSIDEQNRRDLKDLRSMYAPRMRNVSSSLPQNTYYFMPPNRNVFPGAEIYMDRDFVPEPFDDEHDKDDQEDSGSSTSDDSSTADETRSLQLMNTSQQSDLSDCDRRSLSCPPFHFDQHTPVESGTP